MPKAKKTKAAPPRRIPRTPTQAERLSELQAVNKLTVIGNAKGYREISPSVARLFQQYRYQTTNFERRYKVYTGLFGLLVYGLRRCNSDKYLLYSQEILDIVRAAYPSGEDEDWRLTNRNNRPTKTIEVEDLFHDKK